MMATLPKHTITALHKAIHRTGTTHEALLKGIANHAERHTAQLDLRRTDAEINAAIERGIAGANRPVQGDMH